MSTTSARNRLTPQSFSYGIEFEFLVAYLWDDEEDPEKERASELAPVTRLEQPEEFFHDLITESNLHGKIRETLQDHGVPVSAGSSVLGKAPIIYDSDGNLVELFDVFAIVPDSTLNEHEEENDARYKWAGVELKTPPCYSSDGAAAEVIRYVLNLVKSKFRVKVNSACGLHVHVGAGRRQFSLGNLKRVTGLLWAADPLLSCLHPPSRRGGSWSGSFREKVDLDTSSRPHFSSEEGRCHRYFGRDIRFGEHSIEWRQEHASPSNIDLFGTTRKLGHYEAFQGVPEDHHVQRRPFVIDKLTIDDSSPEGDAVPILSIDDDDVSIIAAASSSRDLPSKGSFPQSNRGQPLQEPEHDDDDDESVADDAAAVEIFALVDKLRSASASPFQSQRKRRIPRVALPGPIPNSHKNTVFAGIGKIMSLKSSCELSIWFSPGRLNYNLQNYNCPNLAASHMWLHTVEFREAAGTMDAEWSDIWARIAVGIVRFAIHAPVEDYVSVLWKCDFSDEDPSSYDVIDFLDQIGLAAEADYIERRLEQHAQEWGYMPPSDKDSVGEEANLIDL